MRSKFTKFLLALAITFSLTLFTTSASAYQCRTVGGYWANGYYHHAHKVCWNTNARPGYYNNARTGRYYNNGRYYNTRQCGVRNGQRVCWYR